MNDAAIQVEQVLWLYTFLVIGVTASSWIVYLKYPTFDRRPLFAFADRFHDLTNYFDKTKYLYHGAAELGQGFPIYNYPAPGAFVFKFFLHICPGHAVEPYIFFLLFCVSGFALIAWRAIGGSPAVRLSATAAICVTALIGFPLLFTADRGNTEGVVWVLSGTGLCFLLRSRYRRAAILVGLAASIKPFPILFLLLLVRRKRYREAMLGGVTAVSVIVLALVALGPNPWKAYQDLRYGQSYYYAHYVDNLTYVKEARFGHSLLDGMKSAALSYEMGGIRPGMAISEVPKLMAEPGGWHVVRSMVRFYPVVVIAALLLLIAVFYRMPALNQVIALSTFVTLCPPASAAYTLLQLYVPFGALVVFLTREVATRRVSFSNGSMYGLAIIFGLLFSPLTFLRIYAGDAELLLLLALLVVVARSPMRSEYFGSGAEGLLEVEG